VVGSKIVALGMPKYVEKCPPTTRTLPSGIRV